MADRHSLLARQIRRHFGGEEAVPPMWRSFLAAVDEAYRQSDADRGLLERAMVLSSQELMQANADMRAIFQAIPDLFFRFSADGTILDCKAGDLADLMFPVEELIGKGIHNVPVREVAAAFADGLCRVEQTGAMVRVEYGLTLGGRLQLYEARLLPLGPRQRIAIVRNLTELKQTEEALRASERHLTHSLSLLQATLESTTDGILVIDRAGDITAFNHRLAEMWHIPNHLLRVGEDSRLLLYLLADVKEPAAARAQLRELYANPELERQGVLEFLDGRVFEHYSRPQWIGGECVGRVWSFRDVTERRRAEEERARLQVMGALGHLVGGLAHEVRNPLFAITATLEAILAGLAEPEHESLRQSLDYLREPTARLSELMSELMEYGKPLGQDLAEGSLQEVVLQAIADCAPLSAERDVRLTVRHGERDLRVGMIRRRLLVACGNVIQNAVQHTPPGGTVAVELEEVEAEGGTWARCSCKDSGSGFPAEDLPHLFEPFFSRRPGGTGLGLSIVQRIAEEHRARLAAGNRPEGGAVVILEIPEWPSTEELGRRPPALRGSPAAIGPS